MILNIGHRERVLALLLMIAPLTVAVAGGGQESEEPGQT